MLISLNWIKDYVNLDGIEVDELVKRFGLSTAEVEGVEYKGKNIENVVVAEILSVENHPNSQKQLRKNAQGYCAARLGVSSNLSRETIKTLF